MPGANLTPVWPAASILLLRTRKRRLEVLMMERSATLRFAPGCLVFPGGRVDRRDQAQPVRRLGRAHGLTSTESAFRAAALRELAEEANISLIPGLRAGEIRRGPISAFRRTAALPDMVPCAHWITPESSKVRFDTHFFMAEAPAHVRARADGQEAIRTCWVSPKVLLEEWDKGAAKLMFPTRMSLMDLADYTTANDALEDWRMRPIERFLPHIKEQDGRLVAVLERANGRSVSTSDPRDIMLEAKRT